MNPWIRASWRIALGRAGRWTALAGAGVVTATLVTCSAPLSELERLQERGRLRVVSRYAATTYFLGREGRPAGLDYELAKGFAEHLGLPLEFDLVDSVGELLPALLEGRADLAAGHLTATPGRAERVRFGPAYQFVSEYVVYKRGTLRPRRLADLAGGRLGVVADSAHEETLRRLAAAYPNLAWEDFALPSVEELFEAVDRGELDYAITDSTAYTLNRRYFPEVRRAFDLSEALPVAFAFPRSADLSVFDEARRYFRELRASGRLDRLVAKYYDHADRFDWVGTRTFLRHVESRLPRFEALFREAAEDVDMDWHLLAAMAYQESHWDEDAVSPTLVRGLMMLTEATAAQLGVEDRTSPEQSVLGGARYLRQLKDRLPERIGEPDRTWLALAAYNVGFGHLEDARVITEMNGADPDRWADVREHLPLLSRRQWYTKVRRGYARGRQPVEYVRNIRGYYDTLLWKFPESTLPLEAALAPDTEPDSRQGAGVVAVEPAGERPEDGPAAPPPGGGTASSGSGASAPSDGSGTAPSDGSGTTPSERSETAAPDHDAGAQDGTATEAPGGRMAARPAPPGRFTGPVAGRPAADRGRRRAALRRTPPRERPPSSPAGG